MAESNMRISYYEYNAFIIELDGKTVAIDPGATFFYWFRFQSVIPKALWPAVSHIVVTHGGHPDALQPAGDVHPDVLPGRR